MNRLLLFSLLAVPAIAASEQTELYRFPTGPASWTVKVELVRDARSGSSKEDDAKAPILERIEVTQTNDSRRTVLRWSGGASRELWSLPQADLMVTEDPAGKAFVTRNSISFGDPFSAADFAWIRSGIQTSEETVKFDGVDCYHYSGIITVPSLSVKGAATVVPCEAWINAETLLPVALQKEKLLGRFSFGPPPGNLQMPEKFRRRLDQYRRIMGIH